MAGRQTIAIAILADAAGVRKGTAESKSALTTFSSTATGILTKLGGAYAAFKGAELLKNSITGAVGAVREQDTLLKQSEAVIKSTGGAAGVSAAQIVKMADAMEAKSMTDAEMIQNGANVLMTFTKIRNEAGKGNDIFNQGTQAALDMSTALGTDMKSAATLMGKALNDPVKGVSALGRSGVQFTDDQKKMIKSLVESGDVLGAQKIILKEVNTQFAGSAASAAKADGGVKRLKDMWDGFVESGVRRVLPMVYRLTTWAADTLPGAMARGSAAVGSITPAIGAVWAGVRPVLTFIVNNTETVGAFVGVIAGVAAVTRVWAIAQGVLNVAMSANPLGLLVIGVAALAAGLVYAYKRSDTFRAVVQTVFGHVRVAAGVAKNIVTAAVKGISTAFSVAGRLVRGYVTLYTTPFRLIAAGVRALPGAASAALGSLGDKVKGIGGKVKGWTSDAGDWLKDAGRAIITGLIGGITDKISSLRDKAKSLAKVIKDNKGPISYDRVMLRPEGHAIMDGLINAISSRTSRLRSTMRDVTSTVAGTNLGSLALGTVSTVAAAASQVIHLTVNVNVAPTADKAAIGREVLAAIRAALKEGATPL